MRAATRSVMIAEDPVWPAAIRQGHFIFLDQVGDVRRRPGRTQKLEVERQMRALEVLAVIGDEPFYRQINLTDYHPVIEFVENRSHPANDVMHLGLVGGVSLEQTL